MAATIFLNGKEIIHVSNITMDILYLHLENILEEDEDQGKIFNDAVKTTLHRMNQTNWGLGNIVFDVADYLKTSYDLDQFLYLLDTALDIEINRTDLPRDFLLQRLEWFKEFKNHLVEYLNELKSQGK